MVPFQKFEQKYREIQNLSVILRVENQKFCVIRFIRMKIPQSLYGISTTTSGYIGGNLTRINLFYLFIFKFNNGEFRQSKRINATFYKY